MTKGSPEASMSDAHGGCDSGEDGSADHSSRIFKTLVVAVARLQEEKKPASVTKNMEQNDALGRGDYFEGSAPT